MADPREVTLRALMTADAREFARRELGHSYLIENDVDDPIIRARKKSELKRLEVRRNGRIAAGLAVRKPRFRASGTMAAGEYADGFAATDNKCLVCGRPVDRPRSRTCSPKCARAARAARKAVVNHTKARSSYQRRAVARLPDLTRMSRPPGG